MTSYTDHVKINATINNISMPKMKQTGQATAAIIIVIVVLLAVGVAGYYAYYRSQQTQSQDAMMQGDKMTEDDAMIGDKAMMENGAVMEDEDEKEGNTGIGGAEKMNQGSVTKGGIPTDTASSLDLSGTVLAGTASKLYDYNQEDYQKALASDKLIVLYYYASWCPICRAETRDATYPAFNELNDPDVVGFRVNFNDSDTDDSEKELAREHGVAYQHTKVFVKNDSRVLKSPEQWDKDRYLTEIAKY